MTAKLSRTKKIKKRPTPRRKKTLKELNAYMSRNWTKITKIARANTLALTGKEVL